MDEAIKNFFDTDPVRNKAADEVILQTLDFDRDQIDNALMHAAGARALANRHVFAIETCGDGPDAQYPNVSITAIAAYHKDLGMDERTDVINMITPLECQEVAEVTWAFYEGITCAEIATVMRDRGFQWDRAHQDECDKSLTATIAPLYVGLPTDPLKKPEPPKAAPAKKPSAPKP